MTTPSLDEQFRLLSDAVVDQPNAAEFRARLAEAAAAGRPLRVKLGADPSAPDLHLGHAVVLKKLRAFQECGHTVVFIVGDFTGMIGDPSGKSLTRPQLSREQVMANAKTYQEQVFRLLDPEKTEIHFNSEWFGGMTFENVIRLASHVTIAQLLARDDFAKRYAYRAPIALSEFLYPLVQAYDSVMVKADVELGGTDQLFNLLLGREIQKAHGQAPQIVMTLPLLVGLDGVNKMSKSLGNYIAFNDPAKEVYGKAMSIPDEGMWPYFRLLLGKGDAEVAGLRAAVADGSRHPRAVKDELAKALVTMLHGAEEAETASAEFARVFAQKELPSDIPVVSVPAAETGILSLLVAAGLAHGTSEAKRLVLGGAVKMDDEKIADPKAVVTPKDGAVLRAGKRAFAKLAVQA